jgi:7-cyano-7-deazaguanine synthase
MDAHGKAVILLSGGLDSAVTLALAKSMGYAMHALSFDYGQRHRFELNAARHVAQALGAAAHIILRLDLSAFGGSALTSGLAVPKNRTPESMAAEIPITYVPARNAIFLSVALAWCEVLDAGDIFIGIHHMDCSGYPDCRPAFLEQFQRLAAVATKAGVQGRTRYRIHAPLLNMSKAEIIRCGHARGVDFALTHSCYDPPAEGLACGACDSCQLRRRGFEEAGIPDPTQYARE